jgi:putative Mg2+ transporter-C (MgtC) family protein
VRERLVDALEAAQYPVGDVQVVEHADAPTDVIAVLVSTVSADELDGAGTDGARAGRAACHWEVSTRD